MIKKLILIIPLTIASIVAQPIIQTQAIELSDGTVTFAKSPRLLDAFTTFKSVRITRSRYYFTFELPPDAGEPLQRMTFRQGKAPESIRLLPDDTNAFQGRPRDKERELAIQNVNYNEDNDTIDVVFDPPISPGTTFTIGLRSVRNPDFAGVYLYRVKAYPRGDKSIGLDLGVGRFHFFDDFDSY